MLKDRRGVSACSISSCRIRAEALARAFNTRLWPCSWIPQRSPTDEGMSNGLEEAEEFFEASPSPEKVANESPLCRHKSVATEAGREKLYELLQQHATDDAIDVFYDVSEEAGLTDGPNSTCGDDVTGLMQPTREPVRCRSVVVEKPVSQIFDSSINVLNFNGLHLSEESGGGEAPNTDFAKFYGLPTSNLSNDGKYQDVLLNDVGDLETNCEAIHGVIGSVASVACNPAAENFTEDEGCNQKDNEDENESVSENNAALTSSLDGDIPDTNCASHFAENFCGVNHEVNTINSSQTTLIQDLPPSVSNDTDEVVPEDSLLVAGTDTKDENSLDPETFAGDNGTAISIEVIETSSASPSSETKSPTSSRLQVFEEFRPLISRSTSLKTGKTPPGTPSRKKFVRFADALGLDLEDVRHIMSGDIPTIPSSAYTDLNLKDVDMQGYTPVSETIEIRSTFMPSWSIFQDVSSTVGLHPNFAVPGEQPNFFERVRAQGVCLESVLVSDMCIQCTCRVMNYGFHKKVTVRYTVNDWGTVNDIDAGYVQGSFQDGMDKFRFNIFLSASNRSVKFAIKYVVNGQEFWDNNGSQNYCLSYHGLDDHHQQISSTLWTHQFW